MQRIRLPKLLSRLGKKGQRAENASEKPLVWWAVGFFSAVLTLLLVTLWMARAVYLELPREASLGPEFKPADVIVCLTGGRGRIRKALELYEKGYGKVLYISGTDRQIQMKDILKELKWVGPVDESHIILENVSTNTIENAEQVRRFVDDQGLKTVLLVTSIYHVRRSHYIFRKILPHDVQLEVSWFEAGPFEQSAWWRTWNGIVVTVTEFFKFFYAYLRLVS